MGARDNVSLGFPRRLYAGGNEPPPGKSTNYRSKLELIPQLIQFLGAELLEEVRNSPLGVVIKLCEENFVWSSRIVHQLLTRQLATEKKYELWFVIRGVPLRFTLREFEEVTGLNCGPLVDEEDEEKIEIGLFSKLEIGGKRLIPSLNELMIGFENGVINTRANKLRAGYLIIVASAVMGCDRRSSIPEHLVRLVNDVDKFLAYPWGTLAFKTLVDDIKTRDFSQHSYVIGGFAQVLQVWAYSLFPNIADGFWFKLRNDGPTLLRYRGSKAKCVLENLGEIDMSSLEAGTVEWEDEVEDMSVDNVLSYYKQHKSFEEVKWLPVANANPTVPTVRAQGGKQGGKQGEKRKRNVVEADKVRRAKNRKTNVEDEGESESSDGSPEILTKSWGRRVESSLRNMESLLKKLVGDGSGAENDSPPSKSPAPKMRKGKRVESSLRNMESMLKKLVEEGSGAENETPRSKPPAPKVAKGKRKQPSRKTPRKSPTPKRFSPTKPQQDPPTPKTPAPKNKRTEKGVAGKGKVGVGTRRSKRNQVLQLTN